MSTSGHELAGNASISGTAMGGRQPIVGATVNFYATGTTGYGSAATLLGTATSDSAGNFSIVRNSNTCSDPQQVYLVASGGDPGAGVNSASVLVEALGKCSSITPATSGLVVNELTTIAAAYALQGFADTTVNIGTSSTNTQGLTHAFANAANLVSLNGLANTTTVGGNGTVPSTVLNTLADILAACENSTGPSSTSCTTVLSGAPSAVAAPAPTTAWQEALNMARYPAYNVAALFGVVSPTSPFQPTLGSAPNDLSVGITYSAGFQTNGTTAASFPWDVKADSYDNIWVSGMTNAGLVELSANGTLLSPSAGGWGNATLQAAFTHGLAVDTTANGNIWTGDSSGNIWKYTPAGAPTSPTQGTTTQIAVSGNPYSLGVDSSNNLWFGTYASTASTSTGFGEVPSGTTTPSTIVPFSSTATKGSYTMFVDAANGNTVYSGSQSLGSLYVLASPYTTSVTTTSAGSNPTNSIVVDKNHNIWAVYQGSGSNKGALLKFTSGSTTASLTCTPQISTGNGLYNPRGLALDGNNRLFANSYTAATIVEFDSSIGTGCDSGGTNPGYFFLTSGGTGINPAQNDGTGSLKASGERNTTIDTSGALWTINALSGANPPVVQILGIAAPTNPVLAAGQYGVRP